MKKFNLFNEIIVTNKSDLLNAINSNKSFAIDTNGEIIYDQDDKRAVVFRGVVDKKPQNSLNPNASKPFSELLGKNYQLVEDGDRVLIKAFSNWQNIIEFNTDNASYDDTTADGVAEFSNKELEEIGWHATEFDIKYRTLVEVLEEKCEGLLLCIEQEEPYQFSGLGFLADNEHAKEVLFNYCKEEAKRLMQEDEMFAKEHLDDDELEAAEFFELI